MHLCCSFVLIANFPLIANITIFDKLAERILQDAISSSGWTLQLSNDVIHCSFMQIIVNFILIQGKE